jgi:hypothetical protein
MLVKEVAISKNGHLLKHIVNLRKYYSTGEFDTECFKGQSFQVAKITKNP